MGEVKRGATDAADVACATTGVAAARVPSAPTRASVVRRERVGRMGPTFETGVVIWVNDAAGRSLLGGSPFPAAVAGGGVELDLAQPHGRRGDLDALVLAAELQRLFE